MQQMTTQEKNWIYNTLQEELDNINLNIIIMRDLNGTIEINNKGVER